MQSTRATTMMEAGVEEVKRDYGNGMRYKGEVRRSDGVFEGTGSLWLLFERGRRPGSSWGGWCYSGAWKDGKKHGSGTMRSLPPNCQFSDSADGVVAGKETKTTESGGQGAGNGEDDEVTQGYQEYEYSGGWKDDKMDGMGTEKSAAGVYRGSWRGGLRQGLGTFLHSDTGDKYVGQWENGLEHGQGKEVDGCTGDVLEGEWSKGLLHGRGKQVERGGNVVYEGDWVEGVREGKGILLVRRKTEDGGDDSAEEEVTQATATLVYDGEWKDDKWHGNGLLRSAKLRYEGAFVEGKKHGQGRQEKASSTYEGAWEDGLMHGTGTFHDATSGDEYTGEWRGGKRCGCGRLTFLRDGQRVTIAGVWEDGHLRNPEADGP